MKRGVGHVRISKVAQEHYITINSIQVEHVVLFNIWVGINVCCVEINNCIRGSASGISCSKVDQLVYARTDGDIVATQETGDKIIAIASVDSVTKITTNNHVIT